MKSSQATALVTGAAARIGAAICRSLHARGLRVLVHCNSSVVAAEALAEELNAERDDSAAVLVADLSVPDGVQRLVDACNAQSDRLDVLVNNASRFYPTPIGDTRQFQWDDIIDSNLRGPYFLVQGLLPMLRNSAGCVVNIIDVHARRPMHDHAVYCISKAGLEMMTLALARDLAPGIRVNGVSPGAILWPEDVLEPGDELKDEILSRTALGRLGNPTDIAGAVTFLALDAPYVTGQVLAVDGGRSLNQ